MKIAYLDAFAGISGDMTLGALLDAGLDMEYLQSELSKLGLQGYALSAEKVTVSGISATRVNIDVETERHHHHRHLDDILSMIAGSGLPDKVISMSTAVFRRLAEAEADVHGTVPEKVHFHEVGAVDSILDITGSCIGLYALGVEELISSPLPLGRGFVECAHGVIPLPAPATVKLLEDLPTYAFPDEGETVTPTGAALVASLCRSIGPMPAMNSRATGYGAGTIERRIPNLLRIFIGETSEIPEALDTVILQTLIDDMNPEIYEYLMEKLYAAGALEVTLTPCTAKNSRPAVLLAAVCALGKEPAVEDIILTESTSLGLRRIPSSRACLERKTVEVAVAGGKVRVKLGLKDGRIANVAPEYKDCRALAEQSGLPLKEVYRLAEVAVKDYL
ncbi:MAG: nickel pincer cofactor biosynthesis protein LarC [bacterium]|nr:nickel pincer cofactor biosynthesis protein LarC [bacterium]